jgi:predicted DsbA family dithiol-disulfide isomerase
MKIDFVSDIACPWCAVGLNALEEAIANLQASGVNVAITLHMQPFELNPDMTAEGVDAASYLKKKYGMDDAALAEARATLRARGAEVGFQFGDRSRIWNTFDAHRLLCWAGTVDFSKQRALKHALLRAYHLDGSNPSDPALLIDLATQVGLNAETAQAILSSNQYADEVRKAETFYQRNGIQAVPSVIINDRHLIQGGQPAALFEQAIRQLATAED